MDDTRRQAAETAAYTVLAGSNLPIGYCDAISEAVAAAVVAALDCGNGQEEGESE